MEGWVFGSNSAVQICGKALVRSPLNTKIPDLLGMRSSKYGMTFTNFAIHDSRLTFARIDV
jgi:hypothetical protein